MILAAVAQLVTPGWTEAIIYYGPLGVGWVFGARFIDKLIKAQKDRETATLKRDEARDKMILDIVTKQSDAYHSVAHKLSGVYKGLVYMAATSGKDTLANMAQRELERIERENG